MSALLSPPLASRTREACSRYLSARQREVHHYLGVHCHWFTVQHVGLVAPLLHGFNCSRGQHGMSADQLQVLDRTVLADLRLQQNLPLDAGLAGKWWICG